VDLELEVDLEMGWKGMRREIGIRFGKRVRMRADAQIEKQENISQMTGMSCSIFRSRSVRKRGNRWSWRMVLKMVCLFPFPFCSCILIIFETPLILAQISTARFL